MTTIAAYHGTSKKIANRLQKGTINPCLGGGEMGQGFYLSDRLWTAKSWASNRHQKNAGVLKVEIPESEFKDFGSGQLSLQVLSLEEAIKLRKKIKAKGTTRTYTHGCDVLWSPIVGNRSIYADQYKYESQLSVNVLNGASCVRSVI
jgi:hypothetical protein